MKNISSRTIHRYLSIVIGVQLLFWTTSGLIFSWNPIRKVRGEHLIRETEPIDLSQFKLMSIPDVLISNTSSGSLPAKAELRVLLNEPVYEVTFANSENSSTQQLIFDAVTGKKLSPVSEDQARKIAQQDFAEVADVASAELIEGNLSSHSEYRGKELPVWRIVMDHPTGTVIYVSANRGVVTTRRNNRWRVFDFFWMLHTMDYQGRDNFNSWVLRSFSIFGVATVLSGYWLWWRTSRFRRRLRRSRQRPSDSKSE